MNLIRYAGKYFKGLLLLLGCMGIIYVYSGCSEENLRQPEYTEIDGYRVAAQTGEQKLKVYDDGAWESLVVKGVNAGTALPGRWFTQLPADREIYREWLEEVAALNANVIRVYTLLDPSFYQVLKEFNQDPDNPKIWLIQEVWPEEEVPDYDLNAPSYREEYLSEIEKTIDALHGQADIPAREHRAYGRFSVDVAPYVLGVIIGREIEAHEVEATNENHPDFNSYDGDFIYVEEGSPTECFLAEMCDYAAAHAAQEHGWQYPVSFVSWPTLDPLTHPTEKYADGSWSFNASEVVDPATFKVGNRNVAGLFGSYHIYPNYPDFMNNEPRFAEFTDDEGTFRYRGYLDEFMEVHPPYPAVVAEFGMSSSMSTAHLSPDGLHHGGVDEKDQGEMTVRMMESILDKDYAGGIIFELNDEWAKKTWNVEPLMIPYHRQALWQNAMCPEQNYGLIAMEPDPEYYLPSNRQVIWEADDTHTAGIEEFADNGGDVNSEDDEDLGDEEEGEGANNYEDNHVEEGGSYELPGLREMEVSSDLSFLYLNIQLEADSNLKDINEFFNNFGGGLAVGIDTYDRDKGAFQLPVDKTPELPSGIEFLMVIESLEQACFLSIPEYNRSQYNFASTNLDDTEKVDWERINPITNRGWETYDGRIIEELRFDESQLNYGVFKTEHPEYDSLGHWYVDSSENKIHIRLPWTLLNITDPSSRQVLHDSGEYFDMPGRDELDTRETEGFKFYTVLYEQTEGPDNSECQERESLGQMYDLAPVFYPDENASPKFDEYAPLYLWKEWEEDIEYRTRRKESFDIIADYFQTIN